MYSEVDKPELKRGIKYWKNLGNKMNIFMLHYTADPVKDPATIAGKLWYEAECEGMSKAGWNKEYEIDSTTKSGELIYGSKFCDFDKNIHLIESYELPEPLELIIGLDFGQRNPTGALVAGLTKDEKIYIIDEYYNPAIPSKSSREMIEKFDYLLPGIKNAKTFTAKRDIINRAFQVKVIDPKTRDKNRTKIIQGEEIEYSVIEEFYDNGWEFSPGINDVGAGITRVREFFKVYPDGTTNFYIFKDKCPILIKELSNYRYKENTELLDRTHNAPEQPVKKNDHLCDCLRYLLMTRPNPGTKKTTQKTIIQKDIENCLNKKTKDLSPQWETS